MNRYAAPSTSWRIWSPSIQASCCEGSATNGMPRSRHSSVCRSIASGSFGLMTHQVETAAARRDRAELDARGPRSSRRRRTTPSARGRRRWCRRTAPCAPPRTRARAWCRRRAARATTRSRASPGRPRPTSSGLQAEVAEPERDVRGDAAAADLQVVDEEGQRDLVQLLDDQGVGEPTGKAHQVVGGDGPGDSDAHRHTLRGGTRRARHRWWRARRQAWVRVS